MFYLEWLFFNVGLWNWMGLLLKGSEFFEIGGILIKFRCFFSKVFVRKII